MKVTQCITGMEKSEGGPSRSVPQLCNGLAIENVDISLLYYNFGDPNSEMLLESVKQYEVVCTRRNSLISSNYIAALSKSTPEVIHLNAMWHLSVHKVCRWARRNNVPYLISPRGCLEPYALGTKTFKKNIALKLYQRNDLKLATCIHATAKQEADNIRKLGFTNPIAIIPNGIDLSRFNCSTEKQRTKKRKLLFVSRIHRKKGIDMLIKAWNMLDDSFHNNWELEIVGNKQDVAYYKELEKLVKRGTVIFTGEIWGDNLVLKYKEADLFILPTHSENFGIVIAEALACGVPVITTTGTPWQVLKERNCGWWIEPTVDDIYNTLKVSLQKSEEELREMGKRGRQLMEDEYSKESVARKTREVYEWILGEKEKPTFVI